MMDFNEVRGVLTPKSTSLDQKLSEFRDDRDSWNAKVKKYLNQRNEINRQVKELITEVQNQKVIRDDANSKVKELKIIRAERSTVLKQLRAELQEKRPAEVGRGSREVNAGSLVDQDCDCKLAISSRPRREAAADLIELTSHKGLR